MVHVSFPIKARRAVALVLCLVLALSLALGAMPAARAVSQDEINALKANSAQLETQKKNLQSQLNALSGDAANALARAQLITRKVDLLQAQIDSTNQQIADYDDEIAETQTRLEETQAREEAYYALFCQRVRAMEESGTITYWDILFSAQSFSDLLDRVSFVSEVMSYDNSIVDALTAMADQISQDKAQLEEARASIEAERQSLESYKTELAAEQKTANDLLAQVQAQQNALKKNINSLSASQSALNKKLSQAQRVLAQQQAAQNAANQVSSGGTASASTSAIVATAKQYIGCSYVWGASGPSTFDCSGFTMYVYGKYGVSLPHHAATQYGYGSSVSRSSLQAGDLVFFNGSSGSSRITHVGIYIGGNQFIHASTGTRKVRISSLGESYYSAHYVGARRIL